MNESENRLGIFRELVTCAHEIAFCEFDAKTFEPLHSTAANQGALFFLFPMDNQDLSFTEKLIEEGRQQQKRYPVILTNSLGMVWAGAIQYRENEAYRIYTMGPVFLDDFSIAEIEQKLRRHDLSPSLKREFVDFIKTLPVVSAIRFYEYAVMLHWCLSGEKITISQLHFLDQSEKSALPDAEKPRERHGTYGAEQRMLQYVREGNLQYHKEMNRLASTGTLGRIVENGDSLRAFKDHVIIYTALCCRAAVEGGLDQEAAYSLSDRYIRSIEKTKRIGELGEISHAMVEDYIRRVYRVRADSQMSPQIRSACQLIELNIQDPPDIHTLAEKFGYKDYYFSKKFKQETGMSLRDYILRQKIERAKELLRTGSDPISEISDYLGFSSQSYFGALFKEQVGVSPSEYRAK